MEKKKIKLSDVKKVTVLEKTQLEKISGGISGGIPWWYPIVVGKAIQSGTIG